MRRFLIDNLEPHLKTATIAGADAHHLRHVLRLRPQDPIIVCDGKGAEYQARILSTGSRNIQVELLATVEKSVESPLDLALAQAYLKEKKMDNLVRHLTELGVTRWIPFMAGRSVAVPDPKRLSTRNQRWQKIALEALKQCGRNRPLIIEPAVPFQDALALSAPYDLKFIFWEKSADQKPSDLQSFVRPARVFVMIGPEGGFEPAEISAAQASGFRIACMGPRILRAETAALTAAALVQFVFGDLGPEKS
jgi:16S rRNA (uracil1498-N3)-methyltransferase